MYIKRTLILSKINNEAKKALITVQKNNEEANVKVKFQEQLSNLFAVARYGNSPVEVIPLTVCDDCFDGCLPNYFDCSEEIFIAIIKVVNNIPCPIYLGGAIGRKKCFYDDVLHNLPYYYSKCQSLIKSDNQVEMEENKNNNPVCVCEEFCETDETSDDLANLFNEASESEIDEQITNSLLAECLTQKDKCANCIYKQAFYKAEEQKELCTKNAQNVENLVTDNYLCDTANCENVEVEIESLETEDENENYIKEDESNEETLKDESPNDEPKKFDENEIKFFRQVEKSLNGLFSAYPNDDVLESKIENGKFAKVDYENTGDYYSVGYITENETPKYICYAIPCLTGSPPPKNMENFSQYLPIDDTHAYYLMYQRASNGETIDFSTQ